VPDLDNLMSGFLLAQGNEGGGGFLGPLGPLPPILIIIVLFYFILWMPERKKRRAHEDLLAKLKKNDRVLTVGGIYGTVVNLHSENGDLTIKVDENSNTRMRITRGSVSQVITGEEQADKPA